MHVYFVGASKPSLEVVSEVVPGARKNQDSVIDWLKTDFHSTIEQLLGGTEIIKVAQQDSNLNDNNPYVNFNNQQQTCNIRSKEEAKILSWVLKFHENLNAELNGQSSSLVRNSIDELLRLNKINYDMQSEMGKILKFLDKMYAILVRLQIVVADKPEGWIKKYSKFVSELKTTMQEFEDSLIVLDGRINLSKELRPGDELGKLIAINVKIKYTKLKKKFKVWDDLAKMFLKGSKILQRDDSLILVEPVLEKNNSAIHSKNNDEL